MKKIIAMSLEKCFEFVTDNKNTNYVLISIHDDKKGGFGVSFNKTNRCKDVLELKFDDIEPPEKGTLFSDYQAKEIIDFVKRNIRYETLVIHCFGGISRSQAVRHAITDCLGLEKQKRSCLVNNYVYEKTIEVWKENNK